MKWISRSSRKLTLEDKITALLICAVVMILGLLLFKYMPQSYYGTNITFDASGHVTIAIFIAYFFWYFIDQNSRSFRYTYITVAAVIVAVVAVERLLVGAHDSVGILLGIGVSVAAIMISRWAFFREKIDF